MQNPKNDCPITPRCRAKANIDWRRCATCKDGSLYYADKCPQCGTIIDYSKDNCPSCGRENK